MSDFILKWWEHSTAKKIWDDMTIFGRLFYPIIIIFVYTILPAMMVFLFVWFLFGKLITYIEEKTGFRFEYIFFKKKSYENES